MECDAMSLSLFCFFFFNDTATTEIYTLSLHDALPISSFLPWATTTAFLHSIMIQEKRSEEHTSELQSHSFISYAVFCLKKKKNHHNQQTALPALALLAARLRRGTD